MNKKPQEKRLTESLNPARLAPPPPKPINRIAILVDDSGSMMALKSAAIRYANEQIGKIKLAAADSQQITELSVVTFADYVRFIGKSQFPEAAPLLNSKTYTASGYQTALYDAVHRVVLALGDDDPNASYLLITITDGIDNASHLRPSGFAALLREKQAGPWSFAFLGPREMLNTLAAAGVPEGNLTTWDQTEQGFKEAERVTSQGIGSYYAARAAGQTKTAAFFTDLSKVTKGEVKQKLERVDSSFQRIPVTKETTIREAVEAAGETFGIGRGFYELTKPEKVQSHKDVLLMERRGGSIFGGPEARKILGIPDGPGVTVRVNPGNHGDWRVFVSSTSTNRKLVRGTTLLYRHH